MEVRDEAVVVVVVAVVAVEVTLKDHRLLNATSAVSENEKAISDQMVEGNKKGVRSICVELGERGWVEIWYCILLYVRVLF